MKEPCYIKCKNAETCICIQQKEENKDIDISELGFPLPIKK